MRYEPTFTASRQRSGQGSHVLCRAAGSFAMFDAMARALPSGTLPFATAADRA